MRLKATSSPRGPYVNTIIRRIPPLSRDKSCFYRQILIKTNGQVNQPLLPPQYSISRTNVNGTRKKSCFTTLSNLCAHTHEPQWGARLIEVIEEKRGREHVPPEAKRAKRESAIAIKHRLKASNCNGFESRAGGGVPRSNKEDTRNVLLKEHLLTRDGILQNSFYFIREGWVTEVSVASTQVSSRHRSDPASFDAG